jgi:hypothetical protein
LQDASLTLSMKYLSNFFSGLEPSLCLSAATWRIYLKVEDEPCDSL